MGFQKLIIRAGENLFVVVKQQLTKSSLRMPSWVPHAILIVLGLLLFSCQSSRPMGTPLSGSMALSRYDRKIIPRTNGSLMECYVSKPKAERAHRLPLLFLCQGSGYGSVFESLPMGDYIDLFGWIWDYSRYGNRFRLAFVEKRGVTVGTMLLEPDEADPPMEFLIHDTLKNRTSDVLLALEELLKDPGIDRSRVVVAGFGEGAQVAAAAARQSGLVTHLGFFACGGDAHLDELAALNRKKLQSEKITPEEAEKKTNQWFEEVEAIFESWADVDTRFAGASYAHIISYWLMPPVQELLSLEIPLYVAAGNMDAHVPTASVDRIRLAFLKAGKKNLTFRIHPGLDHSFSSVAYEGEDPAVAFQLPAVFDEFCQWFLGGGH